MRAAEEAQRLVIEALQAERHAVDARRGEIGEPAASTELGLASSVISMSLGGLPVLALAASMIAATVAGSISDGVPPPKKIEVSVPAGQQPRLMREVGEQRLAPRVLVDARRGHGC